MVSELLLHGLSSVLGLSYTKVTYFARAYFRSLGPS